tara:strand:- start:1099 stop:1749 length:651 start_codon:yes stop_codon:yes gene_type:complete
MKKSTAFWIVVVIVAAGFFFFKAGDDVPELDPVDLPDPFLGPEDASIVIVEYSDFQCSYCGAAAGTNEQLVSQFKARSPSWEAPVPGIEKLAEEGKVKFVFKHFPLSGHLYAQKAAEAAEAAHAQGKFWEYHDLLFQDQNRLREKDLIKYAEQLGLDMERFENELKADVYEASVRKDALEGQRAGVSGTPAFFINGQKVEGAQPLSVFTSAIALVE